MQHWLINGSIHSDKVVRAWGYTDTILNVLCACRVREKITNAEMENFVQLPKHENAFKCTIDDLYGYDVVEKRDNLLKINFPDNYDHAHSEEPEKFEPTHIYVGSLNEFNGQQVYLSERIIKSGDGLRVATFSDGRSIYILETEARSLTLLDDIDASCLSIQKRQSELTRLVKQLKG